MTINYTQHLKWNTSTEFCHPGYPCTVIRSSTGLHCDECIFWVWTRKRPRETKRKGSPFKMMTISPFSYLLVLFLRHEKMEEEQTPTRRGQKAFLIWHLSLQAVLLSVGIYCLLLLLECRGDKKDFYSRYQHLFAPAEFSTCFCLKTDDA